VLLSSAILYRLDGNVPWGGIITIFIGLWVIFYVPFDVYAFYTSNLVSFFISGSELFSSESSEVLFSTALERPRYGLIAIIPLFLLGLVGGLRIIFDIKKWAFDDNTIKYVKIPLFVWGVSSIIFSLMHIATGQLWLISRYIPITLPLIIVSNSVTLQILSSQHSHWINCRKLASAIIIIIVLSVALSYTLIAGSAWVNIHTYSDQELSSADWASDNSNEDINSDMSMSALVIQNSHPAKYPASQSSVQSIFYTGNTSDVSEELGNNLFVLNKEMITDGFFIPSYPRRPVPKSQYHDLINKQNNIYSNSESRVLYSRSH
jgi:hypothetical protein